MLCQNCGKNEVNFRYTQVINGVKKEMALCDKCAKSLGLENLEFNMPINLSSFLGEFFGEAVNNNFLPTFTKEGTLQCNNCGTSYEEFIETGKFGCSQCYDVFSNGINNVLKNIHGSSNHVGRRSKAILESKEQENAQKEKDKVQKVTTKPKTVSNSQEDKIKQLNVELKKAIKEERYEDAAKIRDEIKKISL